MLEDFEKDYLRTLSDVDLVKVRPYDPNTKIIADKIITDIKDREPGLEVRFIGAAALGIAGKNDIDLFILLKNDLKKYLVSLVKVLGNSMKISNTSIDWFLSKDGYDIEVHFTNPEIREVARQIKIYELLRDNQMLAQEYEQIKLRADGQSLREYYRRKFEFYNKILAHNA